MEYFGNIQLFSQKGHTLVLYTSRNFPVHFEPELMAFYRSLLEQPLIFCSGWHSPFEKKMLSLCLQASEDSQVIKVMARKTDLNILYKKEFPNLSPERILLLNPDLKNSRISKSSVRRRDQFIFHHYHHILFSYIHPGGYVQSLFEQCVEQKKNIFLFNHPINEQFFWDSVTLVDPFEMDLFSCLSTLGE
jgi:hypothetical protein